MDTMENIIQLVKAERARQDSLKAEGRFPYCASDVEMSNLETLAVLMEEVGEVAAELQTNNNLHSTQKICSLLSEMEALKAELVQVAAVAVAWLEKLEKIK